MPRGRSAVPSYGYQAGQVCRIVGLTYRQLDYWHRSGFYKPSLNEGIGHGATRLYDFNDLIALKVIKRWLDAGLTIQRIRRAVSYLRTALPGVDKPLYELTLVTDGRTIFLVSDNRESIIDTLQQGQLCFSLALGGIVREVEGEIRQLATLQEAAEGKLIEGAEDVPLIAMENEADEDELELPIVVLSETA